MNRDIAMSRGVASSLAAVDCA